MGRRTFGLMDGVLFLLLGTAALIGCGHGSKPTNLSCVFRGITRTDAGGNVLGGDPDDWCYRPCTPPQFPGSVTDTIPTPPPCDRLLPAFPNPNRYGYGGVRVYFQLASERPVRLEIQATGCRLVRTLIDTTRVAGVHSVLWDLTDNSGHAVSPGIYRCLMTTGSFSCHGDIEVE